MTKNTNRKAKFTRGEKKLYTLGVLCFVMTLFLKVFCGTAISTLKIDVEKQNYRNSNQQKKNESLVMQVNELTSYENVALVLKEMGLAYNNENIIVINK